MLRSDAGDKPKAAEPQDDGYETSNSGERPKPPSERGTPPPAPPEPPEHHYEHQGHHEHHEMLPQHEHPQQMQQQQQQVYPQYRPYEPPQHEQPPQDHEPYHHFPFPKYGAPEQYFKRENDAPYDMSQQHYAPKRDDDPLYNGIKRECEDPYSFVEEEAMCAMLGGPQGQMPPHLHHQQHHDAHQHHQMMHAQQMMLNQPKKRGRKKKIKDENGMEIKVEPGMEGALVPRVVKERKKHDRFNGMSEEEVSRRTLPDHLQENLDIIIIGINPGLFAAYKGHHYAGPGNHFWKCLYLSGLTREQMSADEDYKLLNFGIGFTNMVARATKGSADLTRREIKEGSAILLEKLQTFRPKVAVFNGKLIYEVFSGKKDFCFGKQPDTITGTNTYMWVMPSSSARCAQLPRAADKVPFYAALKKFRDYLNGLVAHIEESELVFPDTTSRRPQDELEIRRLTQEPEPGETMILEDGTEVPLKKKRGRPKKVKLENGAVPPAPRPRPPRPAPLADGEQPPKKKRGRPKKVRPEDQQFLMQQQQPLEQPYLHHQLMPHGQAENVQQEQSSFGAGLGGAELGGGGMMYDAPAGDANTYYQQQNAGNSMDGSLGYARQTPVPASNPAPSYIEPRAVYSPAQPRHAQFAHSPAGAGAGAGASTPTYSPRPAGTPQPQFPQSPAAFSQPSPPRYAPAGAAPPYPPQYPPAPFHHPHYDSREPAPQPLRPFSRSPGPAPFPAASPAANSFTMSPAARSYSASPAYSTHSSPAPRTPHYAAAQTTPTPAAPGAGNLCGELSADMDSRSPPCALDFSPPSPADQQENQTSSVGSEMSVGGSCAPPAPARPFDAPYRRHGRLDSPRDHYQDQGQVAGSPQLDQMHQHQHPSMYGNNFNRSTPESSGGGATPSGVGSPFSAHAFRPPDAHPGSPGGDYQQQPKPKPQDVASKSLSGLESLVDQIPSIADGGGNAAGGGAQPGAEPVAAPPPALAEYPPSIYGPYGAYGGAAAAAYGNNGYGAPFVGYGGGWGGQLMRPTPGYLSDWQYGYGAGVAPGYAPYNTPYYNGYAGPPPAHHQQYLGAPPLLDLHKQEGGVPAVPSVPSVGFPGFC